MGNADEDARIQAMMQEEADQWQQNLEDLPQSVSDAFVGDVSHQCFPKTDKAFV